MLIKVTQEHIIAGQQPNVLDLRGRWGSCPVALACQASGFPEARIGLGGFRKTSSDPPISLPSAARVFVINADVAMDRGDVTLLPFEFELDMIDTRRVKDVE